MNCRKAREGFSLHNKILGKNYRQFFRRGDFLPFFLLKEMGMWRELETIIGYRVEKFFDHITKIVKDRLIRVYLSFLFSVASFLVLCFSLISLVSRFATQLDERGMFYWTPSLTFFVFVILGSLAGLKLSLTGIKVDHRINPSPIEAQYKRISQRKKRKPKQRVKKPRG